MLRSRDGLASADSFFQAYFPVPPRVWRQSCRSRSELVATFLSVLELCSMGSIALARDGEEYTVSFVGGDVEEILERIEET